MTVHIRESTNRRGDVTAIAAATTRDDAPNGGTTSTALVTAARIRARLQAGREGVGMIPDQVIYVRDRGALLDVLGLVG